MFLQLINLDSGLPERFVPEQWFNGVGIPIHKTKLFTLSRKDFISPELHTLNSWSANLLPSEKELLQKWKINFIHLKFLPRCGAIYLSLRLLDTTLFALLTYMCHISCARFHFHSLTHGAEPFLRSRQLCSHSRIFQHSMEPEGSLPYSQEPSTGLYPEPYQSNPYQSILSL
jgi:hypothetical protein